MKAPIVAFPVLFDEAFEADESRNREPVALEEQRGQQTRDPAVPKPERMDTKVPEELRLLI
jgi:hypothetical protein